MSFSLLLQDLDELHVNYVLVDSARANHSGRVATWFSVLWHVFSQISEVSHISIHASRSYLYLLPPIMLWNVFYRRSISLRVFGGDFKDLIAGAPALDRLLARWIGRRVSALFLQTKRNVDVAVSHGYHAHWFPNVRRAAVASQASNDYQRRFAFIGQVRVDKGVQVLLDVSNRLDDSYPIDV